MQAATIRDGEVLAAHIELALAADALGRPHAMPRAPEPRGARDRDVNA